MKRGTTVVSRTPKFRSNQRSVSRDPIPTPATYILHIRTPSLLSLIPQCTNVNCQHQLDQILAHILTTGAFCGNLFVLNAILRVLAAGPAPHDALILYNHTFHSGTARPNNFSFPFAARACSRASLPCKGRELHAASIKFGFEKDVFVQNSFIHMYATFGMLGIARQVFYGAVAGLVADVISWNTIIAGCSQNGENEDALHLFREMTSNGIKPDECTMVSVMTACAHLGDLESGRKVHSLIDEVGLKIGVQLGTSLINMYAKCGALSIARAMFNKMPERNVVCWTSMISGFVQSGDFKEAIQLFRKMQVRGVNPDSATIVTVLSACAHAGALHQGQWLHGYCSRNAGVMNVNVKNALMDMYAKCGSIDRAVRLFRQMNSRDVFSWTVIISGLAVNGMYIQALGLFSEMENESVKPNEITFVGVLSACCHGGFIDGGFTYYDRMTKFYKLVPGIEHYGCMVDLLGRAKLISEAVNFVRMMPIKPDVVIWRSLLFACRDSGNVELAESIASKIVELEPRQCGGHVLMSNIYATACRWSDAKRVRKTMKICGVQKRPGCSFIELEGIIYEFLAADASDLEVGSLREMLYGMNKILRTDGYNPDALQIDGNGDGK